MKVSLYLACVRELRSILETTPPPECYPKLSCYRVDQKQAKNKNLHIIFFGGDVTICMYLPPPLCHFLSLVLGTPLHSYPGEVIFKWPLNGLSSSYVKVLSL